MLRDAGKYPTMHRTTPRAKNHPAPNVHCTEVENLSYKILPELSPYWYPELAKNMVKGEHRLISLIIHSFNQCLLSAKYVPSIHLTAGDLIMNQTDKVLFP